MDELGVGVEYFKSPLNGEFTGQYFTSDDGSVKVAAVTMTKDVSHVQMIKKAMTEYEWHDEDFLLATYQKNGTHFMWEVMMMLLRKSADYIQESKVVCMMDLFPVTDSHNIMPFPRVLNTHYRLDVLPKQYRGRKTVLVIRNPKDTAVSFYYHIKKLSQMSDLAKEDKEKVASEMTFQMFLRAFLFDKDCQYGRYFEYVEYMWSLRDNPNLLIVYFEDLKREPATVIQQVNEFMGLGRSPELVEKIAQATNFASMKEGKRESSERIVQHMQKMREQEGGVQSGDPPPQADTPHSIYRKGDIGDWKNHFTVADNELFEAFLDKWAVSKEIPFRY